MLRNVRQRQRQRQRPKTVWLALWGPLILQNHAQIYNKKELLHQGIVFSCISHL